MKSSTALGFAGKVSAVGLALNLCLAKTQNLLAKIQFSKRQLSVPILQLLWDFVPGRHLSTHHPYYMLRTASGS